MTVLTPGIAIAGVSGRYKKPPRLRVTLVGTKRDGCVTRIMACGPKTVNTVVQMANLLGNDFHGINIGEQSVIPESQFWPRHFWSFYRCRKGRAGLSCQFLLKIEVNSLNFQKMKVSGIIFIYFIRRTEFPGSYKWIN